MNGNFEDYEFFQQLPEKTKEKIRNCKSEEEAMEIIKGDMIPIPDEVLAATAGGACYTVCDSYWRQRSCSDRCRVFGDL